MIAENLLQEAIQRLVTGFHPEKVILFGSQARGTSTDQSDVDLLVVCEFDGSRRKLMVEMDQVLKGLGFARDIVVLKPREFELDRELPGTVARPAWKEGRVLYERD